MRKTSATRFLSLLLALAMVLSLSALPVFADDGENTGEDAGQAIEVTDNTDTGGESDTGGDEDPAEEADDTGGDEDDTGDDADEDAEETDDQGEAAAAAEEETAVVSLTLTSSSDVASVTIDGTTTNYTSVSAAITAAGTSTATVAVFGGGVSEAITIADGQNITLDFQTDCYSSITVASGGSLTFNSTYAMMEGSVTVYGQLTVSKSNVGKTTIESGGEMTISGGGATGVIVNEGGKLTVSSGEVSAQHGLTVNGGTVEISGGTANEVKVTAGTLTISGGTVSQSLTVSGGTVNMIGGAISGPAEDTVVTVSGGTMSISGGTVAGGVTVSDGMLNVSDSATLNGGITLTGSGTVNISGGTVTYNGSGAKASIIIDSAATGTLTISGGTINNNSSEGTADAVTGTGSATVTITGGTFSSNVTSYVTDSGYTATYNEEDGTYTVTTTTTGVAKNVTQGTSYETLQAAIDAASSGDEIQLLADFEESVTVAADDKITLDLNGHTLTRGIGTDDLNRVDSPVITVSGTLTLTDSSEGGIGAVYMCNYTDSEGTHTRSGNGGAVLVNSGGSFTLQSGTIQGDSVAMNGVNGGGVYVVSGGTFTMNGGSITGFTISSSGTYGGGVYNAGTFTMTGGTITNNSSSTDGGGGVYNTGTFTMTGGTISSNTCDDFGAGVCNAGTFTMSGGSITGNSTYNGGGVYNGIYGTFTMTGGSITGNTASSGGGVYNAGTMKVSGNPVISSNTLKSSTTSSNVLLASNAVITLTNALTEGASIGISTAVAIEEGSPVQITAEETETSYYASSINYFVSDSSAYVITENDSGYLQIGYEEVEYVAQLIDTDLGDSGDKYTSLAEALAAVSGTYTTIKLLNDVELDEQITISNTIILDLNGYSITRGEDCTDTALIKVTDGTLTIKDSTTDAAGKIDGDATYTDSSGSTGAGTALEITGGAVTLESGTLTGGYAVRISGGTFTASGGKIVAQGRENNFGYGIRMSGGADVTLSGTVVVDAMLSDCTDTDDVKYYGAAVVSFGGNENDMTTLTVNGGTLRGKTYGIATNGYTTYGYNTIVITNGTVSGATAMYLPAVSSSTTISGGIITGSETGIEIRAGSLTVTGGTIEGKGSPTETTANGSGTTTCGAGIAISQHTTKQSITVSISGTAAVTGYTAVWEFDVQGNGSEYTKDISITIEGGTFTTTEGSESSAVSIGDVGIATIAISGGSYSTQLDAAYCAEGWAPTTTTGTDGMYTVTSAVATGYDSDENYIGGYATLADALAAEDAATVKLYADEVEVESGLTASNTLTLDLNGKNLTIGTDGGDSITLTIDTGAEVTIVDTSTDATGVVANYGTITVNGTLDIRDLGYTTDAETAGGLLGQTDGKISLGASATFIVPDVWATQWSSLGEWTPNWTSATGSDGIFSSVAANATVYAFGVGWTCTTEFTGSYDSETTYWTVSGTYLVEYYKTSRGSTSDVTIDVEDSGSWIAPDAVENNTIFAGWYTSNDYTEACDTTQTSGAAYARFVTLSYDYTTDTSGETGVINFLGGSLRMDTEETTSTSLRFGYEIAIPDDCSSASWGWIWTQGTSTTQHSVDGVYYSSVVNTYSEQTTYRSNLVITGIPSNRYDRELHSTLTVTYKTADGTTVTAEDEARTRTVKQVASLISTSQDENVTQSEKDYASSILSASSK